jgi:hypothetical protein
VSPLVGSEQVVDAQTTCREVWQCHLPPEAACPPGLESPRSGPHPAASIAASAASPMRLHSPPCPGDALDSARPGQNPRHRLPGALYAIAKCFGKRGLCAATDRHGTPGLHGTRPCRPGLIDLHRFDSAGILCYSRFSLHSRLSHSMANSMLVANKNSRRPPYPAPDLLSG